MVEVVAALENGPRAAADTATGLPRNLPATQNEIKHKNTRQATETNTTSHRPSRAGSRSKRTSHRRANRDRCRPQSNCATTQPSTTSHNEDLELKANPLRVKSLVFAMPR